MEQNTPKLFAIQFGSLIMLYVSVTALLVLLFNIINVVWPDALTYYTTTEAARSAVRTSIATVVVFFPAYVLSMRYSLQLRKASSHGQYTGVMRWLIYLSLLAAGLILLGDLVTLLLYFLNGEITVRFLSKVLVLFIVIGAVFYYYLQDVRGFYQKHTSWPRNYAIGAFGVVVLTVIVGLMHIETPQMVREVRLDDQMVADLQNIQYSINSYYQRADELPASLDALFPTGDIPQPPVSGNNGQPTAYEYIPVDLTHYQLCATFLTDSAATKQVAAPSYPDRHTWSHPAGHYCFSAAVSKQP